MKVRLEVSPQRQEAIRTMLERHGITVDDGAELVLSEERPCCVGLWIKETGSGTRVLLPAEEIELLEACGHTVAISTPRGVYRTAEPLYRLAARLDTDQFVRISNCAVVAKGKVRAITPTLSMKFILTLDSGRRADVTRSYYYIFKEAFGI